MPIEFSCPNGHRLKVKKASAGKRGRCPICNARIRVPNPPPDKLTEDAILGFIGPHETTGPVEPPPTGFSDGMTAEAEAEAAPHKKKMCPQCRQQIEQETHICPFCHTYIAGLKDF